MLEPAIKTQLQAYMANIRQPIELVPSLDDSAKASELRALLEEIAGLSDKVTLAADEGDARKPSFLIRRVGTDIGVRDRKSVV